MSRVGVVQNFFVPSRFRKCKRVPAVAFWSRFDTRAAHIMDMQWTDYHTCIGKGDIVHMAQKASGFFLSLLFWHGHDSPCECESWIICLQMLIDRVGSGRNNFYGFAEPEAVFMINASLPELPWWGLSLEYLVKYVVFQAGRVVVHVTFLLVLWPSDECTRDLAVAWYRRLCKT